MLVTKLETLMQMNTRTQLTVESDEQLIQHNPDQKSLYTLKLHNDTLNRDIEIENQKRKEQQDKLVKVESEV